jgi:hypothetical protein
MRVIAAWTRLEWRRHWRSLAVLALLVALATATVLAAVAGRGAARPRSAGRLWARTLPATVAVLPNQPGFGWAKIRALPEVAALATFAVSDFELEGAPGAQTFFPPLTARSCGPLSARWYSGDGVSAPAAPMR